MAKKVLVAMSGGVDSSVSAYLLTKQDYDVIGVFMRNGVHTENTATGKHGCCSLDDAYDARRVAHKLGIPFYVLNFKEAFDKLIDYFVAEYNSGKTPNPCVMCNRQIKLGKLFEYADVLGADYVATGHYAQIEELKLKKAVDLQKDQSYVLFSVPRHRLERTLLPLGNLHKSEVRQIAREAGFSLADKPDSQEICFVPDNDYGKLIAQRSPEMIAEGEILTTAGELVGRHGGHQLFTIGKRKGLGVALGKPVYVVDIDAFTNTIYIGDEKELLRSEMVVGNLNWLTDKPRIGSEFPAQVKIRYNHSGANATVQVLEKGKALVRFAEPQKAITPGQAAVFYYDHIVLGGGWIEKQ